MLDRVCERLVPAACGTLRCDQSGAHAACPTHPAFCIGLYTQEIQARKQPGCTESTKCKWLHAVRNGWYMDSRQLRPATTGSTQLARSAPSGGLQQVGQQRAQQLRPGGPARPSSGCRPGTAAADRCSARGALNSGAAGC